MKIRKKLVNGHEYYYVEEFIRIERPIVFSVYLGRRIPNKQELEKKKRELQDKLYHFLLGNVFAIYLTKEQLVEAEKRKRLYFKKLTKLGRTAKDEKEAIDTVNFVYTTLTTEGVPITKEDAGLAYRFNQKNVKNLRDENLRVALAMIKGLRFVKGSSKGISFDFVLNLHKIIMIEYGERNPGKLREKQAYIYLKNYDKAEEIRFRPVAHGEIKSKLEELVSWYNQNFGKLNALELAALLHLRFYMIHPFEDSNKRVSRLLLNKALFDNGYPMLNVSKETTSYFDALINSVENKDERPFVEFVYSQFLRYAISLARSLAE